MRTKSFGAQEPDWAGKVEFIERSSSSGMGTNFVVYLADVPLGTIYFRPLDATWCYRVGMRGDLTIKAESSDLCALQNEIVADIRRRKS